MKTKAKFLMNYLVEVEPLGYGNMQKLLKSLIKTDKGYELKMTNFKDRKDHRGFWSNNLSPLLGKGLIKMDEKTKLYKTTSRGLKYWDRPFSRFIPPPGKTGSQWRKHLKNREEKIKEKREYYERKREAENRWIGLAKTVLLNKKIVKVRYVSPHEAKSWGWTKRPIVFQLCDGTWIAPMMDDEGNDGGALHTSGMFGGDKTLPVLY